MGRGASGDPPQRGAAPARARWREREEELLSAQEERVEAHPRPRCDQEHAHCQQTSNANLDQRSQTQERGYAVGASLEVRRLEDEHGAPGEARLRDQALREQASETSTCEARRPYE